MLAIFDQSDFPALGNDLDCASFSIARELLNCSPTEWVSNVDTQFAALIFNDHACVLTINQKEYANAIVCSPYTTYVTYALSELKKFSKWWVKLLVLINAVLMSIICRITQFNKIVQINNNLNSLLKHPEQFISLLPEITASTVRKYPEHAITFFRVNEALDKLFLNALEENGYIIFPDRMAHVFSPGDFMQHSHTKRDMILLRKSTYEIVPHENLTENDAERIAELYRSLFIDKHSKKNPIYTEKYFENAIRNRWHTYVALRSPDGRIDGFISWFESENRMICGPLGYDAEVDRKMGLYRQLVALCLKHADNHKIVFNMGGGSNEFKLNRGSTETAEYTAVYCKHLPYYRHIPWKIFQWAFNKMLRKIVDNAAL
ncbi:MAG: hypothetical protein NTZ67_09700 [Gammaproteobacteria bacterium]|nr:hypothetical protein [Gammaproteobacteria bacterium]